MRWDSAGNAGSNLLYAGYALRRQRVAGGWAAVVAAGVMLVLQLRSHTIMMSISLVVNLAILALVIGNWRRLGSRPSPLPPRS